MQWSQYSIMLPFYWKRICASLFLCVILTSARSFKNYEELKNWESGRWCFRGIILHLLICAFTHFKSCFGVGIFEQYTGRKAHHLLLTVIQASVQHLQAQCIERYLCALGLKFWVKWVCCGNHSWQCKTITETMIRWYHNMIFTQNITSTTVNTFRKNQQYIKQMRIFVSGMRSTVPGLLCRLLSLKIWFFLSFWHQYSYQK